MYEGEIACAKRPSVARMLYVSGKEGSIVHSSLMIVVDESASQVPSATFHTGGVSTSTVGKYVITLLDYEDSQS
jgi:hypothetical protein